MRLSASRAAIAVLFGLAPGTASAGPPYRTDDPEPVELGHYRLYTQALQFWRRQHCLALYDSCDRQEALPRTFRSNDQACALASDALFVIPVRYHRDNCHAGEEPTGGGG